MSGKQTIRCAAAHPAGRTSGLGRDLRPTTDLRALMKGILRDHLRVADGALAATVFPDSAAARPTSGLIVVA
jgi:uncharacterized protein (DUF1501 family)